MRILVTGYDGYCGWPVVLKLLKKDYEVIGIDNGFRRKWVGEIGGNSILPILNIHSRDKAIKSFFSKGKFSPYHFDLTDYNLLHSVMKQYMPEVILHLASQPSAPYSQIDVNHCNFTQQNNTQMLRNLIWSIKNAGLNNSHLIVTTTTGIYGAPKFNIPEGDLIVDGHNYPFPSMSGSWYHMSRAHDSDNLWLANKQFKFPISEIRTSIVTGTSTEETRLTPEFYNRFDTDFYFGVVVNRFVSMAMAGQGIRVYGKGKQLKPMISLSDMVRSTVNCCELDITERNKKYEIYNQVEQPIAIVDIANWVKDSIEEKTNITVNLEHVPNPRIEDEEHQMVIDNRKFITKLCDSQIEVTISGAIEQMISDLVLYKDKFTDFMKR